MAGFLSAASTVRSGLQEARSFFAQLTGADDPASKGAARVLMRSIRKQLSIKAAVERRSFSGSRTRTEHSAPGESPRRVTGKLLRSVGTEVVGGLRRIGVASFKGRLLEEGVDTAVTVTPSGRVFATSRKSKFNAGRLGAIRRRKGGVARRMLHIAARPFMEKALEHALPHMDGEAVSELQKRGNAVRLPL